MNSAPYQDTQTVVSVFLLQQQQNSFSARLHRTLQHHVPFYYFMLAWITPCALQEPFLEHFHLSSLKANIHHTQERGRRRWPTSRSKPPSITLVLASPSIFPPHTVSLSCRQHSQILSPSFHSRFRGSVFQVSVSDREVGGKRVQRVYRLSET